MRDRYELFLAVVALLTAATLVYITIKEVAA